MKKIHRVLFLLVVLAAAFVNRATAQESASRIVEDGGTGEYKAIMISEPSLATHTVFRPQDLSAFGKKNKLPIIAWGNGATQSNC